MTLYILGAGISGIGAAKLLSSQGHKNIKILSRTPPKDTAFLKRVPVDCFEEPQLLPEDAETLILSPSVPINHPLILQSQKRHIPVLSEIDLALQHFHGRIIGVTGTNGKSSTVDMLEHILKKDFFAKAAGNIGLSPCGLLAEKPHPDILILELSSYQLELSRPIASEVSIWTTFSEDHLARHKTMKHYFDLKSRLIQSTTKHAILGPSVGEIPHLSPKLSIHRPAPTPGFPEQHNQINAAWALLAAQLISGKKYTWEDSLADYTSLPHRFERLQPPANHIINDSKSTNLESTLEAVKSTQVPLVLWIGGLDKGEDFSLLAEHTHIKKIILFGKAHTRLFSQLSQQSHIPLFCYNTLKDALHAEDMNENILFSPGCASQDEFQSFEHRGQFFCHTVYKKIGDSPCTLHKPKNL
ncbi:MAG: Mur ligase family protein [Oligoflexales bacterium]